MRPKEKRYKTFNEAAEAVDLLLASQAQQADESASEDGSEEGDRNPVEAEEEDEPATATAAMGRIDDEDEDDAVSSSSEEEEDDVVLLEDPHVDDEEDEEARTEFDREFARMLVDTSDARRGDRKIAPMFDTAVPLIKKRANAIPAYNSAAANNIENGQAAPGPQHSGGMAFTLLSKKGNKQQLRNLDIPLDSAIALNSMSHQQRNKAEQEQLKRLVLQNERRQGQSEMLGESLLAKCLEGRSPRSAIQEDAKQRGIRLRFVPS